MSITLGNRFVAMFVGVLLLCVPVVVPVPVARAAVVGARAAVGAVGAVGAIGARGGLGARDAWLTGDTVGRGQRWVHGGAVDRVLGKVYFTLDKADYVCSGVVVRSEHADVVLTAAHCVSDGAGHWATNWTFVPDYRDGGQPYGAYTARRFFVDPHWATGKEQYDVAFVQVNPATIYGTSGGTGLRPATRRLPAGLPVAFAAHPAALPLAAAYVFGYPSELPFSGEYPNYCAGRAAVSAVSGGGASTQTRCGMTAGDSGGPWLARFRPRAGSGVIVAVSTFKLSTDLRVLYGTVLGPAARRLYLAALSAEGQPRPLISRARAKSLPVSPPAECVTSVRVILFQLRRMSGWWLARSARKPTATAKSSASLKSFLVMVRVSWPSLTSHPGVAESSAAT
jgi:V8-like Glu-specific endopeptidase